MIYLIMILAVYSLSFYIRNLSGPFNIFGIIRNSLMRLPWLGVFFYQLLDCPWCLGWYMGCAIYLLQSMQFSINLIILWGLAGSAIVAFLDVIYDYLISIRGIK